jgi:hypothetical protein
MRRARSAFLSSLPLLLFACPAGAQSAGAPADPSLAVAPPPAPIGGAWAPQPARALTLFGAPGRGVTLATGDDFFSLTLRGRAQVRDTVVAADNAPVTNEVAIRTMRLIFSGHVYSRQTQYVVQLAFGAQDYEAGMVSPLYDAWVAFNHLRDLRVRVGQFFVPFDRARTNAEWGLHMIDRPLLVSEATLDRDVGVELSSDNLGGLGFLAYRLGVFGGEGKNRLAAEAGLLYVARLQANVFGAFDDSVEGDQERLPRPRLAVGVAGAYNHNAFRQRSTQGATLQLGSFDYLHAAADVTLKWRGLYLFGEALYRRGDVDHHLGAAMGPPSEHSRSLWGYVAQAGMMLTNRLELTARWEQAFALGDTDPALIATLRSQGNQFGAGLNWYQAGHGFKAQADYHYIFGDDFDRGRHQVRMQVQVSF